MPDISDDEISNARIQEAADAAGRILLGADVVVEPASGTFIDALARMTREAPLQSLAVAFLLGVLTARRR
jgi:hypothetical protein